MYGVKYRLEFVDEYGRQKRADLLKKDYTGETITEKAGAGESPLSISLQNSGDEKYETVKGTEIQLEIYSDNFEFEEITEAGDKDFMIKVYQAPVANGDLTLKHVGYVIPEIYSEPYIMAPYPVTIRAASLGILNNIKYDNEGTFYTGTETLMTIITRCLDKLDYGIDIWDSVNTYEDEITDLDDSPLTYLEVDQEDFIITKNDRQQAKTCLEVLEDILKPLVVNFFQDFGRWVIIPIELRATSRYVRIYNSEGTYQSSSNYNPLDQDYNWIDQDQNLDFKPQARLVESVYEHGLPKDVILNHLFEDDFITITKASGEIRYPSEWVLSDENEFDSTAENAGIRNTSVESQERTEVITFTETRSRTGETITRTLFQRPSSAVFFNSYYITDGEYIQQTGTKQIEAGEVVRFKVEYAGDVRLIAGAIEYTDTKQPEDTIDHTFQFKLGSKYLDSNGAWQSTATDIVLNDLGDANSGYPANFNRIGVANGFRSLEIVSDPVEETGTIEARIYKPVSQNEGATNGDTYATVSYSLFSGLLYPNGLPPEEQTNYFTEEDVDSFSDEIDYPIRFGDGPTNFHLSSYLIDRSSGDNLETVSWTRGDLAGSIHDIIINTLFLEYGRQSWMIQGTQRVRGLFDRWFYEYGRAYSPISGSYDERFGHFNGELVEILNAEIPVFGEELPAPENFAVEVDSEPYRDFDDELFYVFDDDGVDDKWVRRCTVDSGGTVTVTHSWQFPTSSEQTDIGFTEASLMLLSNGNVVAYCQGSSVGDDTSIYLLDSELNFINSVILGTGATSPERVPRLYRDYDDSIIVPRGTSFTPLFVRKYDKNLNSIWDSEESAPSTDYNFSSCQVTKNHVVIRFYRDTSNPDLVKVFEKETGDHVKDINIGYRVSVADGSKIENFPDGRIFMADNDSEWRIYDEDMDSLLDSGTASEVLTLARKLSGITENSQIILTGGGDQQSFVVYNDDMTVAWDSANTGTDDLRKLWITTDSDVYRIFTDSTILEISISGQTTSQLANLNTEGIDPGLSSDGYGFATKIENPWVQAPIDTGTPDIQNASITASPDTDTVPFTSTISYSADNNGDADITIPVIVNGVQEALPTIPAGGSVSDSVDVVFPEPGTFEATFAGASDTITANGDTVSGDFEGYVEIDSAAVDDTDEEFPTADFLVLNTPSQDSDCSGGTEFNVDWKSNEYCILISTSMTRSSLATAVSGSLDSQADADGLDATNPGLSPSGYPIIRVTSQTGGTTDNGEEVVFGVPSILEGNGGIFNRYSVNLSGGVEEYILSEEIDILIGGAVFATTDPITALATADTIAQEIYDACVAVGSGTYTFAKNGTRVTVGSTSGAETLDLDIKNAGFEYTKQDIQ